MLLSHIMLRYLLVMSCLWEESDWVQYELR